MTAPLAPGDPFPDLELPDHAGNTRGAGVLGRFPWPAGPVIERYGSAQPWPADRFGSI